MGANARITILHGYTVEDGARLWRDAFQDVNPGLDIGSGPTHINIASALRPHPVSTIPQGRADALRATATHHPRGR
jgi:hypothetical protein